MGKQDDPERVACIRIDRFDKNIKTTEGQDRAREEEEDLTIMLEDAVAVLEPLESAEPTKAQKGDSVSRQEVKGMIASVL